MPDAALPRSFYVRPTIEVARDLLGRVLVHRTGTEQRAGRIVEVEAYGGPEDRASHARSGGRGRARVMYGAPGHAYVFVVYGFHSCFNVVAHAEPAAAGAVLVRAIEVLDGPDPRGSGPALACRALAIDRSLSGEDLVSCELFLAEGQPVGDADVRAGPRVGVEYAGAWAALPWRFWIAGSTSVSRGRRGEPLTALGGVAALPRSPDQPASHTLTGDAHGS